MRSFVSIAAAAALFTAHAHAAPAVGTVVVTSSMLESAAREILPDPSPLKVVSILPPSSCPGHFDLNPGVLPELKTASAVIRHDFQNTLDEKIRRLGGGVRAMDVIAVSGSPLIPAYYDSLSAEIAGKLAALLPGRAADIAAARRTAAARNAELERTARRSAAPWRGTPVIAAVNAAEFCEWLGFRVSGVLKRPEDMTPRDLETLMRLKVRLVVGNFQEGAQGAISLGEKMGVPVAVISNFPGLEGYGTTYSDLVIENLNRIGAAWRKR